jgi:hypothetical protein
MKLSRIANGNHCVCPKSCPLRVITLVFGALPSLPGFWVNVKALPPASFPLILEQLHNYAWFIGFALAFTIYLVLRKFAPTCRAKAKRRRESNEGGRVAQSFWLRLTPPDFRFCEWLDLIG